MMPLAIEKGMKVTMMETVLGSIWLKITRLLEAPSALAAITFGTYLQSVFPVLNPTWLACGLIVLLAIAHGGNHRSSSVVQRWFTAAKVLLIPFLIASFIGLMTVRPMLWMQSNRVPAIVAATIIVTTIVLILTVLMTIVGGKIVHDILR